MLVEPAHQTLEMLPEVVVGVESLIGFLYPSSNFSCAPKALKFAWPSRSPSSLRESGSRRFSFVEGAPNTVNTRTTRAKRRRPRKSPGGTASSLLEAGNENPGSCSSRASQARTHPAHRLRGEAIPRRGQARARAQAVVLAIPGVLSLRPISRDALEGSSAPRLPVREEGQPERFGHGSAAREVTQGPTSLTGTHKRPLKSAQRAQVQGTVRGLASGRVLVLGVSRVLEGPTRIARHMPRGAEGQEPARNDEPIRRPVRAIGRRRDR